ncbi:hypothetical protein pqer_cds_372 [Pandoravirus quercus]|uniref:OTU domain-containing protein n=1 Tax=Pandoravirus quercus TaxID=2107709 RepID=A0A2U7U8N3_9VIRU|nr:hypothetical protein pqer_cds_372 [Pandoravirus quercus]AVK74794.1 hypothetical protein pqer_cds_372 [Pandoravirus quercus]
MARRVVAAVDPNDRACTGASRPPAWMLSECTSEAEAAHVRDAYRLVRTAANGDCLFHSVRLGLLSVPDSGAPTSARLREAVARTVLDRRDRAASAALVLWRDVLTASDDPDVQRDYAHARALVGERAPFTDTARRRVYEAMCDSRVYWGDDYAVSTLSRLTGVDILVVARSTGPNGAVDVCRGRLTGTTTGAAARWRIVLCLDGAHYRPLVRRLDPGRRRHRHGAHTDRPTYVGAFGAHVPRFVRRAFAAVAGDAATSAAARAARRIDPLAR